jgi:glycosyltransferase involved in cell wall biosynthesis
MEKELKSIRILYVAPENSIEGSNTSLRNLIIRLKSRSSFEEMVLVPSMQIAKFYIDAGLRAQVLKNIYIFPHVELTGYGRGFLGGIIRQLKSILLFPRVFRSFGESMDNFKPDLIHLNEVVLLWHAMVAHRRSVPVVMHDRAAVARGGIGLRRFLFTRILLCNIDALIAICPSYVERLGVAAAKAVVIPNPFWGTLERISPQKINEQPSGNQNKRVLLIGARHEKGLFEAMRAIELARGTELVVIGQIPEYFVNRDWSQNKQKLTPYQRKVAEWLKSHKQAAQRIRFEGVKENVFEAISQSGIVLVPWMTPHFSRPLFEAWLMKRPVIAFDTEGVREFCVHGENALIVPRGDWRSMARAITKIINNPTLQARLGDAGYATAIRFIGNDDSELRVFQVYQEVLSNKIDQFQ